MIEQHGTLLDYLRRLVAPAALRSASDQDLLAGFTANRDQACFTALVARHGPMVMNVCRRVLGNAQATEDAFQATFMVLARNAGSVRRGKSLPAWLYGVAYRVALNARRAAKRRPPCECLPNDAKLPDSRPDPLAELTGRELLALLEEEIQNLPAVCRMPVALCCLDGLSLQEAARRLGLSEGAVKGQLERGRVRLHARLVRRGLTLAAVLGVVEAARGCLSAAPGKFLVSASVTAGVAFAAGQGTPMAGVSAEVVNLAQHALKAAAMLKLKLVLVAAFVVCVTALGASDVWHPISVLQQDGPKDDGRKLAVALPPKQPKEKNEKPRVDQFGDVLPPDALARLGTMRLRRDDQSASSLAFTPDGLALVAARARNVVAFWNPTDGRPLHEFRHDKGVNFFTLSADGKLLVMVSASDIAIWDVINQKELRKVKLMEVWALGIAADNQTIAYVGRDRIIRLADVATGQVKRELPGHKSNVKGLFFTPKGDKLISADRQSIHVWDLPGGKHVSETTVGAADSYALSADGTILASGGSRMIENRAQPELVFWDVASGQMRRQLDGHDHYINAIAFSADGKTLATAEVATIHLWDIGTGKELRRIENASFNGKGLAFSPDGKTLSSTCGGNESVVRLWDVATGKPRLAGGHDGTIQTVAFSPDGKMVATGTCIGHDYRSIRVWESATGKLVRKFEGHTFGITKVLFKPDGKELLSASTDGTLRLWDVTSGREIRTYSVGGGAEVRGMALSPDCKKLTAIILGAHTETAMVWDVATGKLIVNRTDPVKPNPFIVPFSADGTITAADQNETLFFLREIATGKVFLKLEVTNSHPRAWLRGVVAFSPDGTIVAAASARVVPSGTGSDESVEDTIHFWEMATGNPIRQITGIKTRIDAIAFSPDARTLATAGEGSVQLWDVATGKKLLACAPQDVPVFLGSIAFSPDGTKLVAGYMDATALVWDLTPGIRLAKLPAKDLTLKDVDQLCTDLAADDAGKAHEAAWTLVAAPQQAVPRLQALLKPVPTPDAPKIQKWIADLESDKFLVRESASRELEKVRDQIKPLLEKALADKVSLETCQRIERILKIADNLTPATLQTIRAIMVLEKIGSPEARRVLRLLAQGAAGARETEEAKAALARLEKRMPGAP